MRKRKGIILFIIVTAQFLCTSLWFAGNAVAGELSLFYQLDENFIGLITSMVQFGFIAGTLLFAFLKISDRFSPSSVFFFCALLGAVSNGTITLISSPIFLLILRFMTGFFLAGIYPVGMKIASDYHKKGLGIALGYLVGALVLGTASPHLLKNFFIDYSWQVIFYSTSLFSLVGGLLIFVLVPDGPYRKKSQNVDFSAFLRVFSYKKFRTAAFGYFGHMWELYAFWAFVPSYLILYVKNSTDFGISIPLASFLVVGIGSLSCVLGGYLSEKLGSGKVAGFALATSLICCILSPFVLNAEPVIFLPFVFVWGMAVIMDSPQFSTLVARYAPPESTGTALTIVNSIGFAITIVSIQLVSAYGFSQYMFYYLIPGPMIGLLLFIPQHLSIKK